jgi:hypothetical protein
MLVGWVRSGFADRSRLVGSSATEFDRDASQYAAGRAAAENQPGGDRNACRTHQDSLQRARYPDRGKSIQTDADRQASAGFSSN